MLDRLNVPTLKIAAFTSFQQKIEIGYLFTKLAEKLISFLNMPI
ncbi:hypothetical protein [Mariprofundus sp. NF]|nr:hypothetical protein [Mariprofundus sp. NF]